VVRLLQAAGAAVVDMGTDSDESVDYPDYAERVARAVAREPGARGILLCGTGIGMAITANKIRGIRAAVVGDVTGARMSRAHNDANVLCLGGGVLGERLIADIVEAWMATPFDGGRHQRRLDKIAAIEAAERVQEEET
jgi:ribose 5-phosphate isomerase B